MSTKSILDIEVNAQAFDRYRQLFEKYQAAAAKQPGIWKAVSKEQAGSSAAFNKMAAAVQAQARVQKEIGEVYKAQNQHLMQGERLWGTIGKHVSGIAGSILNATRSLLSWSGIIGGISGLVGFGGLFGIDKMARNVSNERSNAMGLGMSIGQKKAFDITFGSRGINSEAYLGWIAQMESDPSKISGLGVGMTGNTAKDSISMLRAIRAQAKANPGIMSMLPSMYKMDGMTPEGVRILAGMSNREFEGLAGQQGTLSKKLDIGDKTAEKWQDFLKRLDEAKGSIFKTLVQGLERVEKPLENLSGAFEKFIQTLLKSDMVQHAIDGLAEWLDKFSGKLSAPAFLASVERFTSDVGEMADAIHIMTHPRESADKAWTATQGWFSDKYKQVFQPNEFYKNASKEQTNSFLANIDAKNGLPAGTMARIWQQESSSRFDPPDSAKGAAGPFGLMPRTAAAFGADPHSFVDSAGAAGYYLNQLRARYKGDLQKSLAAYNWGPANVDYDVKQHGKNWQNFLPRETQNYLKGTSGNITVNVNITTPPGSDIHATASAVAH